MQSQTKKYRLVSLVILTAAVMSIGYSLTLPLGTPASPGAGAWPLILSAGMGVAALVTLVTEKDGKDYEPVSRRTWIIVVGFGLMAAFVVAFTLVGLTLSCFALMLVWLRWMARESWKLSLLVAAGCTLLFVVGFDILLKVPMPVDPVVSLIKGLFA